MILKNQKKFLKIFTKAQAEEAADQCSDQGDGGHGVAAATSEWLRHRINHPQAESD